MARQTGEFIENQFVRGLITEATGLNFPEKAVSEAWNTRFNQTAEVTRRLGYDIEAGKTSVSGNFFSGVTRSFTWKNPGNADTTFLVTQTGHYVSFFEPDEDGNFSDGKKAFDIRLATYRTTGNATDVASHPAEFAIADGSLLIVHPICEPLVVSYDPETDTISVAEFGIEIRDFEGVDDGLADDERPTTLSIEHEYNLKNQGWYPAAGEVFLDNQPDTSTAIESFFSTTGFYPNNSEIWWYYKTASEEFNAGLYKARHFGNSKASKGHYIYNAFNIDRASVSGISGVEGFVTTARPSVVAFYAGRAWFGGIDDKVYYSQIVQDNFNWGKCYQNNDPTAEDLSDLLDTDGGVIKILGMGKATALFSSVSNLFVFATNGIWVISGSGAEGTGFVATDFSVRRISTVNLLSSMSLVDVEGSPVWWNLEGIWGAQYTAQSGIEVRSLTNDTIKTFLEEECLPANRAFAQGAFNATERTIQWLFRSTEPSTITESFEYDRILEFNTVTGAFYPFKWETDDIHISSVFSVTGARQNVTTVQNVVDSSNTAVLDSTTANVTVEAESLFLFKNTQYKYLVNSNAEVSFLEESDGTYVDFEEVLGEGVPFTSYFISGANLVNNGKYASVEYLTVFCKHVENGSVDVQARWDWSNAGASGKWSTPQQCYTVNRDNRDVSRKRLLIRGSGPAVQFKWSSREGLPFNVIGWSGFATSDA